VRDTHNIVPDAYQSGAGVTLEGVRNDDPQAGRVAYARAGANVVEIRLQHYYLIIHADAWAILSKKDVRPVAPPNGGFFNAAAAGNEMFCSMVLLGKSNQISA
jgi:hypothetical protein